MYRVSGKSLSRPALVMACVGTLAVASLPQWGSRAETSAGTTMLTAALSELVAGWQELNAAMAEVQHPLYARAEVESMRLQYAGQSMDDLERVFSRH